MRIIIQRVWSGSVTKVETGEVTGKIDRGLLLYFGINRNDKEKDIDAAVKKVLGMKLWDSADGKKRWCRSVVDMKFEVLVVSQFTLYAVLNGTKPDFHESMQADQSHPFFDKVVQRFKDLYSADKIQTGAFEII
ncbi:D-aminoacyl-tRNA deacylase [Entamoeba marina]